MVVTASELEALLLGALWPFVRVSTFVAAAPILGTRAVPGRVKAAVIVALTAVLVPTLPPAPAIGAFSAAGWLTTVQQVLIGLTLGLAVRLTFLALEFAGQLIGAQMGLGFAAMIDPQNGTQVAVVGQLYVIVGTLAFVAMNGHLLLIELLMWSFEQMPVGAIPQTGGVMAIAGAWAGWLFAQALLLALPALVVLTVVNVAIGIMTRASPQLNVFAIGFPVSILIGIGVLFIAAPAVTEALPALVDAAITLAQDVIRR